MLYIQIVNFFLSLKYDLMNLKKEFLRELDKYNVKKMSSFLYTLELF